MASPTPQSLAKATPDELNERAGVTNLNIEVVLSTAEVLEHAWLLETASEGVLKRDRVPSSIRDASKNVTLWSRHTADDAGDEFVAVDVPFAAEAELEESLAEPAEAADEDLPAPPSGGQEFDGDMGMAGRLLDSLC